MRTHDYILVILIFFFFSGSFSAHEASVCCDLDLCVDADQMRANLATVISQPFFLRHLTFDVDIPLTEQEFNHLVDLTEGSLVTPDDVQRVCFYLQHKKRFERVCIDVQRNSVDTHFSSKSDNLAESDSAQKLKANFTPSYDVHFHLMGSWLFRGLAIDGMHVGKDEYRNLYQLESGQRFEEGKHHHSCEKIRERLYNQGYCAASIKDEVRYDQGTKSVDVILHVDQGPIFSINELEVIVQAPSHIARDECKQLHDVIHAQLNKRLVGFHYSHDLVVKERDALARYLLKQGYVQTEIELQKKVDTSLAKITLVVSVHIRQKKKIKFTGNSFFSEDQLLDQLVYGHALWLLPVTMLNQQLQQLYKKKGFWHVTIDVHEQDQFVTFAINEGSRATIKKIEIKDVHNYKPSYLAYSFFKEVKRVAFVDSDFVKKACDDLIAFYLKEGFWDVKVLKHEYVPLQRKDTYQLVVVVDEGTQRFVTSVSIPGHEKLLRHELFRSYKKGTRVPFDIGILHEQKRWLLNHFYKEGYRNIVVVPELHEKEGNVAIEWNIQLPETHATFGKTIIRSNGRLPFDKIMREIDYREGDTWDRSKLERSLKRLRNLEIFESIYCAPPSTMREMEVRPVIFHLIEDNPFEIRTRFGVQKISKSLTIKDGTTYKIGGSLLWKNPFNQADQLRLDADVTRFNRAIVGSYRLPWIFNIPINTVIKGYSTKFNHPTCWGSRTSLYDATQEGFLFSFTRAFDLSTFGMHMGVEWTGVFESPITCDQLACLFDVDASLVNKKIPYAVIEPHATLNCLDNPINPTHGFLTWLSLKSMIALDARAHSFMRFLFEHSFFVPAGALITGVHLRLGHIFDAPFASVIPTERFYLGGANSLRGYEPDSAPPLACLPTEKHGDQFISQGGSTMFNANLEIRFPVFRTLGAVLFQDAGFLMQRGKKFNKNDILASSGFGIRFNTPIGPLRFDIGWKWKKRHPDDVSYAWYLTFGHAF